MPKSPNKDLVGESWIKSSQKRSMDKALALASLPLAVPLAAVAMGAVRLIDKTNPTFAQERSGIDGEAFTIHKLTTLGSGDHKGVVSAGYNDSRATKLGRALRVIGADELPQLVNVIGGDMSFIGPRPLVEDDFEHMMDTLSQSEYREWERAYTMCRPGIISKFAVLTHRPDPLVPVTFYSRAASDVEYAETANRESDQQLMIEAVKLLPTLLHDAARGIIRS